jgi:hypothetical protein
MTHLGPVANDTHMNTDVVLLGRTRQGEWVVLIVRDLRTADEYVLACSNWRVFFLDLDLEDFRGVLFDLGDICDVAGCSQCRIQVRMGMRVLASSLLAVCAVV